MKKKIDEIEYTPGSYNLWADLGYPNADEMLVKANLTFQINNLIKEKKLTPLKAAKFLGVKNEIVEDLADGQLSKFSLGELMRFLTLLGVNVIIDFSKAPVKTKAEIVVRDHLKKLQSTKPRKKQPITKLKKIASTIKPKNVSREPATLHAKKRK